MRRLVDGGVAGTLLAASWLPLPSHMEGAAGPAAYAAAAAAPPPLVAWVDAPPPSRTEAAPEAPTPRCMLYTVAPGDDLWEIARRCYGDGTRFVEIFEASRGSARWTRGEHFSDPRVDPARLGAARAAAGAERRVPKATSRPTACAAATTSGGSPSVSSGTASAGSRSGSATAEREVDADSRFTDPNQIHPGWLLELPVRDGAAILTGRGPGLRQHPPRPSRWRARRSWDVADAPDGAAVGAGTVASEGAAEDADALTPMRGGGWDWEWPRLPRTVTWSAAGFVVIGGTAIFVQRLHRAGSLRLRPGAGRGGDGPGDAGRVALATAALGTALADLGFGGSLPLLVLEGGSGLQFTVACPPGDAGALLAARHDLERRLGCDVEAAADGPTRVALTLPVRPGGLRARSAGAPDAPPALVVPVGASDAGVVYLNLAAAGTVTVTGTAGERRALLRSWVATLQTTCAPDELSFRVDAAAAGLLDADAGLLYFGGAAGAHGAADLADELDEIIQSRSSGHGVSRPLVAVFDPAGSGDDVPAGAMRYGPAAGVFVICCLPPGESADDLTDSGALVAFGAAGDGADGDADGIPPGAIVLRTGRDEPLLLEPVHVRRDTSARWSESADPAATTEVLGRMAGNLPPPREPDARTSAGGRLRTGDDREGGAEGLGAALAHPVMPHDPLAGFSANDGGGQEAVACAPGLPDSEPEPDRSEPVGPAVEQDAGFDATRVRSTVPPEQPEEDVSPQAGEAPGEAITSGEASQDEGPVAQPEPQPVAPGSMSRPAAAIRQSALLTHDDLAPAAEDAPPGAQAVFTVRCLGAFELRLGATPVAGWPIAKSRELLAFLATQGGRPVPRESVAEALWPDSPWDASLRHTIANAVSSLRGVVRSAAGSDELQPVVTARQRYELQTALFRIDLDEFESALRRAAALTDVDALAEYERAAALCRGDFLAGEPFPWLDAYRADYRRRAADGASRGAAIAERIGERERASLLYRVVLEQEPTDEAAARG